MRKKEAYFRFLIVFLLIFGVSAFGSRNQPERAYNTANLLKSALDNMRNVKAWRGLLTLNNHDAEGHLAREGWFERSSSGGIRLRLLRRRVSGLTGHSVETIILNNEEGIWQVLPQLGAAIKVEYSPDSEGELSDFWDGISDVGRVVDPVVNHFKVNDTSLLALTEWHLDDRQSKIGRTVYLVNEKTMLVHGKIVYDERGNVTSRSVWEHIIIVDKFDPTAFTIPDNYRRFFARSPDDAIRIREHLVRSRVAASSVH